MKSPQAQAAAQIRKELKKNGIRATVKSRSASMMTAVDITVYDQAPASFAKIRAFCEQYQYGSFDGMRDLYEYTNSRDDLPQVKYVQLSNEISDHIRAEAERQAAEIEGSTDWQTRERAFRILRDETFWTQFKPRVRAA